MIESIIIENFSLKMHFYLATLNKIKYQYYLYPIWKNFWSCTIRYQKQCKHIVSMNQ